MSLVLCLCIQSHQWSSKLDSHWRILAYPTFLLTNYHSHADVEKHHTVGKNTQKEASANQHCPDDGSHPGSELGTGHSGNGCYRRHRTWSMRTTSIYFPLLRERCHNCIWKHDCLYMQSMDSAQSYCVVFSSNLQKDADWTWWNRSSWYFLLCLQTHLGRPQRKSQSSSVFPSQVHSPAKTNTDTHR